MPWLSFKGALPLEEGAWRISPQRRDDMKTLPRHPFGILLGCVLFLGIGLSDAPAAPWLTDLRIAKERARQEKKAILLNFTGSDWCGWCKKLKAEVFDQPEFETYAGQNLILVEVDFPHAKPISSAQRAANEGVATTYKVRGYPTLIVLNSNGEQIGETGYHPGGPKTLISQLGEMNKSNPSQTTQAPQTGDKATAGNAPLFPWLSANARAPKPQQSELKLKGLAGNSRKPLALINNETFSAGEELRVTIGDKLVRVLCLEIRGKSVLVKVEGEDDPRELKLGR